MIAASDRSSIALVARTSIALGAASATLVAALLIAPARPPSAACAPPPSDGILTARMASGHVLPGEQHVAITVAMPGDPARTRPPLSLAIVIDRSGSMTGAPLANAKAAAARLVDALAPGDAFSVVTYSSSDEVVMPMMRATADTKAVARERIEQIWDDGNTCISCGLERGASQLLTTPVVGGVRRMVLISDGQANTGLYDRGELAALASETSARGISISTVGVGLDFDELTMMRLADVGHGNYYFVEDTATLGDMFARELAGLSTTVAADARLVIDPAPGVLIEEAYGYQLLRQGSRVVVSLPDMQANKPLKVVLRTSLAAVPGPHPVGTFQLHWRRVSDGTAQSAVTALTTHVTTDETAVAASVDPAAIAAIEQARTARILEEATSIYERDGHEAANRIIERHRNALRANKALTTPAAKALDAASSEAIVNFSQAPPEKAKKAARSAAFDLAR